VTGDICLLFPAKELLYALSICYWTMENYLSEVKRNSTHFLTSISGMANVAVHISFYQLKSSCELTGDACFMFQAKELLCLLSICYCSITYCFP